MPTAGKSIEKMAERLATDDTSMNRIITFRGKRVARRGDWMGSHRLAIPLTLTLAVLAFAALWLARTAPGGIDALQSAESLSLYLPVANVTVNLPLLVALGFVVGVLSGMTGVGGAFVMTPLLMMMGVPASPAVGTGGTQIAGTAASGTLAHLRLGNVDVKLGLIALAGSLIGGTIGVHIVAVLREFGNLDFWVRIVYVLLSGTVGTLMLWESVQTWARSAIGKKAGALIAENLGDTRPGEIRAEREERTAPGPLGTHWPLQTEFKKARVRASLLLPFGLGLGVGVLAAVMGVGGGFILVPAMIYLLGVPTHVAVGTSLFQLVFTAANVGFQQALTNQNVDVILALMLMVGAAVGAQIGARIGHRLEAHQLRAFLAAMVLLVMLKMLLDIVLPPGSLIALSVSGGGVH